MITAAVFALIGSASFAIGLMGQSFDPTSYFIGCGTTIACTLFYLSFVEKGPANDQ